MFFAVLNSSPLEGYVILKRNPKFVIVHLCYVDEMVSQNLSEQIEVRLSRLIHVF